LLQLWKPWETKQNSPGHENKGELLGRWKKKREREHRDKKDYDNTHIKAYYTQFNICQ
jgi:hypothetical protein